MDMEIVSIVCKSNKMLLKKSRSEVTTTVYNYFSYLA